MKHRRVLKIIGLVLFVPAIVAAVLPQVAIHSDLLDRFGEATIAVGQTTLFHMYKTVTGDTNIVISGLVWVVAGLGELLLLAVAFLWPKRPDRFKITPYRQ